MPLALQTVDAIFARMAVRYGSVWIAKWNGVPIDAVHTDWARELDGIGRDAIVYALGFLPLEFPPTSTQFRAICERAPERQPIALPAPDRDPEKAAELAKAVKHAAAQLSNPQRYNSKAWAHLLEEHEEAGERLTLAQREMWRAALGRGAQQQEDDESHVAEYQRASS